MKNNLILTFALLVCSFAAIANQSESRLLEDYYGQYTGFTPTDESPTRMGEIRLAINAKDVSVTIATGLQLHTEAADISRIRKLERGEVASHFKKGSLLPQVIDGFQLMPLDDEGNVVSMDDIRSEGVEDEKYVGIIFLFWRSVAEDEARLVMRMGEMSEILGPTVLYDEQQVLEGKFAEVTDFYDQNFGKFSFPRIAYNGKLRPE